MFLSSLLCADVCLCSCPCRLNVQFRSPILERKMVFPSNNKRLRMFPICCPGLFIGLSPECFAVVLFLPLSVSALCSPVATPWDVAGPSRFRPSVHLAATNWPLQPLISSRCSAAAAGMHTLTAEVNECSFVVGTLVCRRCGAREARKVESAQLCSSAWSLSEAHKLPS